MNLTMLEISDFSIYTYVYTYKIKLLKLTIKNYIKM